MRLVFCLFRFFPFGGLARDMLRIADTAHKRGHHVRIVTAAWQGGSNVAHSVEVIPISGSSNHRRAMSFANSMQDKLRSWQYDKVVGFNKIPGLDIYYAADPCFAARARYTRHALYRFTPRYKQYHRLEQAVFRSGTRTHSLVLSERARDEYQEFHGTEDFRFTLLPPNLSEVYQNLKPDKNARQRVRDELGIGEHDYILLMVGSGFATKGVDRSIAALTALSPKIRQSARLVVVGQGKAQPFVDLARKFGVANQVKFLGGRDDVPDLMRAASLLIHPAYSENTGTVLLEAMATGLPVLTTSVCGYAHHVQTAKAGCVLTAPFIQRDFNRALESMLCGDLDQWSSNGRRYVRQFKPDAMPEAAVDAIEQPQADYAGRKRQKGFFYVSNRLNFDTNITFKDIMNLSGKVYRQLAGRRTVRFVRNGRGYFLKTHSGVGWREIFKNLIYLKQPVLGANNEWHALHLLGRLGVRVPTPFGFGQSGANPAARRSFIIMEEVKDALSLEELVKRNNGRIDDVRLKRALISSLANIARTMHLNGINHRDFYLCHFLIGKRFIRMQEANSVGEVPLTLIDLHRAQIRGKTPRRWIIKDLGGLYFSAMHTNVTHRDLLRFIKIYCAAPLRNALKEPVNWDKVQWRAYVLQRSAKAAQA